MSRISSTNDRMRGSEREPKRRSPISHVSARSPRISSGSRRNRLSHRTSPRRSPARRRVGGAPLSLANRLSRGGRASIRGNRRGNLGVRKRKKKKNNNWKRNRRRRLENQQAIGGPVPLMRLRMDDYKHSIEPQRGNSNNTRDAALGRVVVKARREASTRTKDVFWTKKLLDVEDTQTNRRWVHSGFKELYRRELGYSDGESPNRNERRRANNDRVSDRKIRKFSPYKSNRSDRRRSPKVEKSPIKKSPKREVIRKRRPRRKSFSPSSSSSSSFTSSSYSRSRSRSRSSSLSSSFTSSSLSSLPRKRQRPQSPVHRNRNIDSHLKKPKEPPRPPKKIVTKSVIMKDHKKRKSPQRPVTKKNEPSPNIIITEKEISHKKINLISARNKALNSKPIDSDSLSDSSSDDEDGPRKMSLSERFGKLAQLSSQRQEYEGVRMKIVREGGQDKKVYLEGSPSRSKRGKSGHEKWLQEHKKEYDDYEKRYGTFREWDPHRDLPRELPPNWEDVNVRYRYYKESNYFGDKNITMEDYLKWEDWWYKYRDWLEKYGDDRSDYEYSSPPPRNKSRIRPPRWVKD